MWKNEIELISLHMQKINLIWNWDLIVRPETMQLLEENIGEKLPDTDVGKTVLDMTPKAQAPKAKVDRGDFIKLKSFLHSKGNNHQREETIYKAGENIC